MTREEAIESMEYSKAQAEIALSKGVSQYWKQEINWTIEAIDMAIEALNIVCCGECEHGIVETGSRFPFEGNVTCELDHVKRQWFKNDFCSYGERSEE